MSSVLGRTVEGNSSLFGVGLFMLWLVLVAVCVWEVAGRAAPESDESDRSNSTCMPSPPGGSAADSTIGSTYDTPGVPIAGRVPARG